jgi:hypothetical protein
LTIVIDDVGTWAANIKGAQTMMPTQIANATRDVKSVFDLRNEVLMSFTFHKVLGPPVAYGQRLFTVYPAAAPLSTAVPLLLMGTLTLTVAVELLPNESVTLNVIV